MILGPSFLFLLPVFLADSRPTAALDLGPAPALQLGDPFQVIDFDEAKKQAQLQGRLILVELVHKDDPDCQRAHTQHWQDQAVLEWVWRKTIAVRMEVGPDGAGAAPWSAAKLPTLVLCERAGDEIGRLEGLLTGRELLIGLTKLYEERDGAAAARRAIAAAPEDPRGHLQLARALRGRRVAEAVDAYFKAWDLGEKDPTFRSELLQLPRALYALAKHSATVTQELRKRRTAILTQLLAPGEHRLARAEELAAIDDAMGDPGHLIEVIDALRMGQPPPSPMVLRTLTTELVLANWMVARRYDEVARSLEGELEVLDRDFAALAAEYARLEGTPPRDLDLRRRNVGRRAVRWYEVCAGTGQNEQAQQVADLILLHAMDSHSFISLCQAAHRAGQRDAALAFYRAGMETLPKGKEREQLRAVIGRKLLGVEPE
jgi:hypothetical protein